MLLRPLAAERKRGSGAWLMSIGVACTFKEVSVVDFIYQCLCLVLGQGEEVHTDKRWR